jgi:peptide/nickel transport system substrate-binding protein
LAGLPIQNYAPANLPILCNAKERTMQQTFRLVSVAVILALILGACAQPVPIDPGAAPVPEASSDQTPDPTAAAGEAQPGGIWMEGSIADAENLNPILSSETGSSAVTNFMFPVLIAADPFTGETTTDRALAESWEVSEDGLTWTFRLREGITWSDGDPVDSADFKFTYDAIGSDLVETPRKSNLDGIASIEAPDPLTVVVTFAESRCDGLNNLGLPILPSHLYAADFSDIMTSPLNENPTVSAGPLLFQSWTRDDNITMTRNESYWRGAPYMEGRIIRVIPDTGAQLAQLQNGELDTMALEPDQIATAQTFPNIEIYRFEDDGYDYIALNQANPENPQPGQDENGNLIEQDPHPVLSDVNVRKAIAHALDYQTIIDNVYLGQGYQIASNVLPAISWAHDPTIEPYAYDLEQAAALLEEAGWVDADGDGVREKEGQPLELTLLTNAGNTLREDLGALVQDQLNQIGFDVTFEAIDFGVLVETMLGQTFDMVIIGWTGTGTDPNDENLWATRFDTPGSGFNFVSYHNPEMDELLTQGVTVPGCAPEERAPFYKEIQQIIHDDVPYVMISGGVGNVPYNTRWQGINPGPWTFFHNVHEWYLTQ